MFINEKAQNLVSFSDSLKLVLESLKFEFFVIQRIEPEIMEKIQESLREVRIALRNLNECQGIFQFPIENDQVRFSQISEYSLGDHTEAYRVCVRTVAVFVTVPSLQRNRCSQPYRLN